MNPPAKIHVAPCPHGEIRSTETIFCHYIGKTVSYAHNTGASEPMFLMGENDLEILEEMLTDPMHKRILARTRARRVKFEQ